MLLDIHMLACETCLRGCFVISFVERLVIAMRLDVKAASHKAYLRSQLLLLFLFHLLRIVGVDRIKCVMGSDLLVRHISLIEYAGSIPVIHFDI